MYCFRKFLGLHKLILVPSSVDILKAFFLSLGSEGWVPYTVYRGLTLLTYYTLSLLDAKLSMPLRPSWC